MDEVVINCDEKTVGIVFDGRLLSDGRWLVDTLRVPVRLDGVEYDQLVQDQVPFAIQSDASGQPVVRKSGIDDELAELRQRHEAHPADDYTPAELLDKKPHATKSGNVRVFGAGMCACAIDDTLYSIFSESPVVWAVAGFDAPLAGFLDDPPAGNPDILIMPDTGARVVSISLIIGKLLGEQDRKKIDEPLFAGKKKDAAAAVEELLNVDAATARKAADAREEALREKTPERFESKAKESAGCSGVLLMLAATVIGGGLLIADAVRS